jgi:hypothetical protein
MVPPRWGSIDNLEQYLDAGSHVLGQVFKAIFVVAAQAKAKPISNSAAS